MAIASQQPGKHSPSVVKSDGLFALFFPAEPRGFPGRRGLRSFLRGSHILTAGVLLGGHIFAQPEAVLHLWALAAVGTGLALFATDLHASCAILFEIRGVVVAVKLTLTALVPVFPPLAVPLLVAVLFLGAWSSHMPGRYRHRLWLFQDRLQPDQRRG